MRQRIGLIALAASLCACASQMQAYRDQLAQQQWEATRYYAELTSVERPEKTQQRWGPSRTSVLQDSGVTKYSFEDSLLSAIVFPSTDGFSIAVKNKTEHTVKVIWDEAAIVDQYGASGRVMHAGVKYTDRNSSQPPTVIVRRGLITDDVVPTDHVYFTSGTYGGWRTRPLLQGDRSKYLGKTIALQLPFEIEGVVNEYLFTFEIKDRGPFVAPATAATRLRST